MYRDDTSPGKISLFKTKEFIMKENTAKVTLEPLNIPFSVCKVIDYTGINIDQPFVFTGRTDEEKSLVCPTGQAP